MNRAVALAAALIAFPVAAAPPRDTAAGEQRFRELYEELVETNTTLSAGDCTLAAERMAARLRAAGFQDSDLHAFSAPGHEKEGGLVAVYAGRDPKLKANPPARAHRRRRGEARRLDARSVHAHRGEWIVPCARRHGRQGPGRDLDRPADSLQNRELPAATHAEARADLR
jgi:hypothetical protein